MKVKDNNLVQIGELAKSLEITTRTIRYYEEIGLMPAPKRLSRGIRVYNVDDTIRLRFILKLKELGISLNDMQNLAEIYQVGDNSKQFKTIVPRLLEILDSHISIIDKKISKIASLRQEICDYRTKIVSIANETDET